MADKKSFLLRMDPALFDALQHWAEDEFRSLNAQIEFLLRDTLKRAGRLPKKGEPTGGSSEDDS